MKGIGIWGNNQPVGWAFDIINFVWWIGIGHAGTLISAILLLFKQDWRTSINRFAEAMTLFAVACALLFPLIHTGRPWLAAYWLLPYPNTMGIWPQFRSPLIWDVFAVSTYGTVSALFWYTGLVPDLATLRDRAKNKHLARLFGALALGWRGSARHWERYETAYLLLAGMSTPLVLSVHTVVSFDFSVGIVPGWHATIFPPYFVAGAIYAGFAMVLTLAIPLRKWYGHGRLHHHAPPREHGEGHAGDRADRVLRLSDRGVLRLVQRQPVREVHDHQPDDRAVRLVVLGADLLQRPDPADAVVKRLRTNLTWLFIMSLIVSVGMWLERFVIIVTSLHRDFLPSSWDMYYPTFWDFSTFFGTIGLFTTLMFLFVRVLPMISIFEVRTLVPEAKVKLKQDPAADYDVSFGAD